MQYIISTEDAKGLLTINSDVHWGPDCDDFNEGPYCSHDLLTILTGSKLGTSPLVVPGYSFAVEGDEFVYKRESDDAIFALAAVEKEQKKILTVTTELRENIQLDEYYSMVFLAELPGRVLLLEERRPEVEPLVEALKKKFRDLLDEDIASYDDNWDDNE